MASSRSIVCATPNASRAEASVTTVTCPAATLSSAMSAPMRCPGESQGDSSPAASPSMARWSTPAASASGTCWTHPNGQSSRPFTTSTAASLTSSGTSDSNRR